MNIFKRIIKNINHWRLTLILKELIKNPKKKSSQNGTINELLIELEDNKRW
jgi:hypothetical protein